MGFNRERLYINYVCIKFDNQNQNSTSRKKTSESKNLCGWQFLCSTMTAIFYAMAAAALLALDNIPTVSSLSCPEVCACPKVLPCCGSGELVKDMCGCCYVCAKVVCRFYLMCLFSIWSLLRSLGEPPKQINFFVIVREFNHFKE